MLIFRLFSIITLVLLNSCADSPAKPSQPEGKVSSVKTAEPKGKPRQKELKTSIDPDVLFMLLTAELAGQRGQYDVALEGYMEAAKRVHDPRFAERAAMIAMYMKDSKKTYEAVALWLRQDPKNQTARKIAALSALKAGDKKAAVEHLNVLLKVDPAGFENALLELANIMQKDGNQTAVSDVLDALSKQHPNQAEIYFMQSLLAMQKKDKNLAEIKIQQALKVQPDWDKALIFQAQIAVFSGDLNKAKTLLKEASRKYPDNNKINKLYAQVLIKAEDYEEACEVYKKIISSDPKDIESQFALGLVYLQLEQDEQSEDIFKKLLPQIEVAITESTTRERSIQMDQNDFKNESDRKSFSFNLEFIDGVVVKGIKGRAMARDLARVLEQNVRVYQNLRGKHLRFKLDKGFTLWISQ